MQLRVKSVLAGLTVVTLLAVAGCDGDTEGKTTAIGNPKDKQDQSDTNSSSSTKSQPAPDRLHPVVVIETSLGSITAQLDAENAPQTVENFLAYIESGHYDETIFHQVFKGQGVVGGGYTADLSEKPPRTPILTEAHNGLKNLRGTLAMVRQADAIDSAASQFFFNLADNPGLDHQDRTLSGYGYCVFGKVTEGMDVVDKIGQAKVNDTDRFESIPVQTVLIESVRRVR